MYAPWIGLYHVIKNYSRQGNSRKIEWLAVHNVLTTVSSKQQVLNTYTYWMFHYLSVVLVAPCVEWVCLWLDGQIVKPQFGVAYWSPQTNDLISSVYLQTQWHNSMWNYSVVQWFYHVFVNISKKSRYLMQSFLFLK